MGNKRKRHKKKRKETKDTCTESRGLGLEPVGVKISEASGIDAANKAAENGRVRAATTVGLMSLLLLMQFVTFLIRSVFFLTALLEKEPKITVTLC